MKNRQSPTHHANMAMPGIAVAACCQMTALIGYKNPCHPTPLLRHIGRREDHADELKHLLKTCPFFSTTTASRLRRVQ